MILLGNSLADATGDALSVGMLIVVCGYLLMASPLAVAQKISGDTAQRFRDFAEAASDWLWETDEAHRLTFISSNLLENIGIDQDVRLGRPRWETADHSHPVDWGGHRRLLDAHEPFRDFVYPTCATDGELRWIRVSGKPLFNAEGDFLGYRGVASDCTVERVMREEMTRTNALLAGVLDVALDGFLVLSAIRDQQDDLRDFTILRINQRAARLLRATPRALLGKLVRAQLAGMIDEVMFGLAERTLVTGEPFDFERTLPQPEGPPAEVRVVGVRFGDGLVVTISDVAQQHAAERQRRLAMTVFAAAGEAMMVTDANQRVIAVNPAFTAITGYTVDEVLGRNPRMLSSGRHGADFYGGMWRALHAAGRWTGEVWNRHKSGQVYVQRLEITVVRDVDDSIRHYVGVFADITDEKRQVERLHHRAYHDALTGLPNRLLLTDRLRQAVAHAERDGTGVAVVFIDLDGFKPVNDTFGHQVGDMLLQAVAVRLAECVRQSDTVARLGGDEFVLVSCGIDGSEDGLAVAAKVLEALLKPFRLDDLEVGIGASLGVALYPLHGTTAGSLLEAADQAMYSAKLDGKGTCRLADGPLVKTAP